MAHFPKDDSEEGDFDSVSALMRYEATSLTNPKLSGCSSTW